MSSETKRLEIARIPGAVLLGTLLMAVVQSGSQHLAGNDGYYHLRMAAMLPEHGFLQSFPWLRWTILHERFVSHHHGFHVLLMPFAVVSEAVFGDAVMGGKAASAVAMGATFGLLYLVLRELRAPLPWLWLVIVGAGSWHFWLRMAYVRAPMAAMPLLLLAVLWCIRGRVLLVGVLAFFFAQIYGGGVIFPLVPLAFLVGGAVCGERLTLPLQQCLAAAAGGAFGLVVNPYFPGNLTFLYTQIFETGLGASKEVGNEWQPYPLLNLSAQAAALGAILFVALIRRLRTSRAADGREIGLLLLNAIFFLLTIEARRFIEYWPVFAVLNAADFFAGGGEMAATVARGKGVLKGGWLRPAVVMAAVIGAGLNLLYTRARIEPSHNVRAINEAMAHLQANSPSGSLVFTDDWDIFPVCFYFNQHNTYAVGLDPEFTRSKYPALWERYRRITRGQVPATLPKDLTDGHDPKIGYSDIGDVFGARYVLVADDHEGLYKALKRRSDEFILVYPKSSDGDAGQPKIAIFEVRRSESDGSWPASGWKGGAGGERG